MKRIASWLRFIIDKVGGYSHTCIIVTPDKFESIYCVRIDYTSYIIQCNTVTVCTQRRVLTTRRPTVLYIIQSIDIQAFSSTRLKFTV